MTAPHAAWRLFCSKDGAIVVMVLQKGILINCSIDISINIGLESSNCLQCVEDDCCAID